MSSSGDTPMAQLTLRELMKALGALGIAPSAAPLFASSAPIRRIGVALVGLGYYSTDLLAPALQLTQHYYLAGIVTGAPQKIPVWQKQYGLKDYNIYNYD